MPVYTNRLNLYKPDRTDPIAVDTSLAENFQRIDDLLGDALYGTDKIYATLGERLAQIFKDNEPVFGHSVKSFGAVGNGIIDDTLAFQKAVEHVEELGGGTIYIPFGDYLVNGSMELTDNIHFYADNGTQMRKNASVYDTYMFTTGRTKGVAGYGGGAKNISFTNIIFRGIATSVNVRTAIAITFNHAQKVVFKNCGFVDMITNGHALDLCGCDDVLIEDCYFVGAFNLEGREYVEAIQIDSAVYGAFGEPFLNPDNLPTKNVTVRRCQFLPSFNANGTVKNQAPNPIGNHGFTGGKPYTGIVFTDNVVVDGWTQTGGNWRAWIHFYGLQDSKFNDNLFINTQATLSAGVIGLYTSSGGRYDPVTGDSTTGIPLPIQRIEINNNTFKGFRHAENTTTLIRAYGTDYNGTIYRCSEIEVINNKMYGAGSEGAEGSGANLIQINNYTDVIVRDNRAEFGARLLSLYGGWGAIVEGNKADKMSDGVIFLSTTDNFLVRGNMGGSVRRPLEIQESRKGIIANNMFDSVKQTGVEDHACRFKNLEGAIIQGNMLKNVGGATKGFYVYQASTGALNNVRMYDNLALGFATPVFTSGTLIDYLYRA